MMVIDQGYSSYGFFICPGPFLFNKGIAYQITYGFRSVAVSLLP